MSDDLRPFIPVIVVVALVVVVVVVAVALVVAVIHRRDIGNWVRELSKRLGNFRMNIKDVLTVEVEWLPPGSVSVEEDPEDPPEGEQAA